jgi:signal transduction histidine kinase
LIFTLAIFYFSSSYRLNDYIDRLKNRAYTTARLLLNVKEVDETLLRIIDKNTLALNQESIFIFDEHDKLIYNTSESDFNNRELLEKVKEYGEYEFKQGENDAVGLTYEFEKKRYIIIASAHDIYGIAKIRNLKIILIVGYITSVLISILAGSVFAGRALAPISAVVKQVKKITITNLNLRVDEGNKKDEIAQLAITFNQMLQRLEEAFILQREFVSNAAHELRTPFAVMLVEIDYSLMQQRRMEQYQETLRNLSKELKKLSKLTNGLLDLAKINFNDKNLENTSLRIDELLVETCNEVQKNNIDFKPNIDFSSFPDDEEHLYIKGNEQLLKTAFKNLIENACKFSSAKEVNISLIIERKQIEIQFRDQGIGISNEDIPNIFQPFYRGANTHFIAGYGLGLALTQKIIQLHNGNITVKSELGKGSVFSISFPGIETNQKS